MHLKKKWKHRVGQAGVYCLGKWTEMFENLIPGTAVYKAGHPGGRGRVWTFP